MKHAQNTIPPSTKAVAKTTAARSTPKAQGKKRQGSNPSRDELVRLTAYCFYQARQGADGSDLDDWLRAEAQVDELAAQSASPGVAVNASTRAGLND